jgi:flagellin-like hook-associated protein FlgL
MGIKSASCDLSMLQSIKSQINKTQTEVQQIQQSTASDIKKQHYYEIDAPLAGQNLEVEDLIRQNELKLKNYDFATNLLYMQESAINRINNIINDAKKLSVIGIGKYQTTASPNMSNECKSMLLELQDELFTSYFGMNIWNGSRTNELPFKDIQNGKPNDNYYLGDNFDLKFHIDTQEFTFGDRANFDCFKNLISALQMMRDSQDPSVTSYDDFNKIITDASNLLDNASKQGFEILQKVGEVEKAINGAKEEAQDFLKSLTELYNGSLNGMSEEDRVLSVVNASAVQRKLAYLLPITMKYFNDMSVIKYL